MRPETRIASGFASDARKYVQGGFRKITGTIIRAALSAVLAACLLPACALAVGDAWDGTDEIFEGATPLDISTTYLQDSGMHDIFAGDVDFFSVTLTGGSSYYFSASILTDASCTSQNYFEIYNPAQGYEVIISRWCGSTGVFSPSTTGVHYIKVQYWTGPSHSYRLRHMEFTNHAPPTPEKPVLDKGTEMTCRYITVSTTIYDPDALDYLAVQIDINGDGNADETRGTYGPHYFPGGFLVTERFHAATAGNWGIRTRVVDGSGVKSGWSTATPITITANPRMSAQNDAGSGKDAPNNYPPSDYLLELVPGNYSGYLNLKCDTTDSYAFFAETGNNVAISCTAYETRGYVTVETEHGANKGATYVNVGITDGISFTATFTGTYRLQFRTDGADSEEGTYDFSIRGVPPTRAILDLTNSYIPPSGAFYMFDGITHTVVTTVSNTGNGVAQNVGISATAWKLPGYTGAVDAIAGPEPAGLFTLNPNESVSFTYTYSPTGNGYAHFTYTVTGFDAALGQGISFVRSADRWMSSPGVFYLSLAGESGPLYFRRTGETQDVIMRAASGTNEEVSFTGYQWHAVPADPIELVSAPDVTTTTLKQAETQAFIWRLRNRRSTPSYVVFSVTMSGVGIVSGKTREISAWADLNPIVDEGYPELAITSPTSVLAGADFTVSLSVSNAGLEDLSGLVAEMKVAGDAAVQSLNAAPRHLSQLAPGNSAGLSWDFHALKPGSLNLEFTVTASGKYGALWPTVASRTVKVNSAPVAASPTANWDRDAVGFPNPATGDAMTVGLKLAGDASEVEVAIYSQAMKRVYRGIWRDVPLSDPSLRIDGLGGWAPGVYQVRARARLKAGGEQVFPPFKIVVRR